MSKNIQTHNADINLIKKFLDYANCAYASYASLKYVLYSILGILVIASFNACSFKSIDPQYYKFKRLCKNVDSEVTIYNQDYWEMYKNYDTLPTDTRNDRGVPYFYNSKLNKTIYVSGGHFTSKLISSQQINSRLSKAKWGLWYDNIHFATIINYNYKYSNIRLQGDEGMGWHWETEDTLICENLKEKSEQKY